MYQFSVDCDWSRYHRPFFADVMQNECHVTQTVVDAIQVVTQNGDWWRLGNSVFQVARRRCWFLIPLHLPEYLLSPKVNDESPRGSTWVIDGIINVSAASSLFLTIEERAAAVSHRCKIHEQFACSQISCNFVLQRTQESCDRLLAAIKNWQIYLKLPSDWYWTAPGVKRSNLHATAVFVETRPKN